MRTAPRHEPDPERAARRVADGIRFFAFIVIFGSVSIGLLLDPAWSGFQPSPGAQVTASGAEGSEEDYEYGLAMIVMTIVAVLWGAALVLTAIIGFVVGLPLRSSRWGRRVQARLLPVTIVMSVVGLGLMSYASARSHDVVTGAVGAGLLTVGLANLHIVVPAAPAAPAAPTRPAGTASTVLLSGDTGAAGSQRDASAARWRMPGAVATLVVTGCSFVALFVVLVLGWLGATGYAPLDAVYPFLVAGLIITVTAAVFVGLPLRVEPGIRLWWTSRPFAAPITAAVGLLLIVVGVGAHVVDAGSTPLAIPIVVGWTVLAVGLVNMPVPTRWTASGRPRRAQPPRVPRRPRRVAPGAAALIDG